MESLEGKVFVECAELTGLKKAEIQRLKAFLSRQNDNSTRGAYQRYTEDRPRMAVIGGTSNEQQALPFDPDGNRRFAPNLLAHRLTEVKAPA